MMVNILLAITVIVYSAYAYLPFLNLGTRNHYLLGMCCAILGSILWVTISRTVEKQQILTYGLIFDALITMSFAVIPALLLGGVVGRTQILACTLILSGIILIKFQG